MDLVYIPEVLAYGSFRSTQYRDYEQPWNRNYFDHGTTAYEQHCQRQLQAKSSSKNCELCKENKRRSLATYIRQKIHRKNCTKICEEEEESDESVINHSKSLSVQGNMTNKSESERYFEKRT